MATLQELLAEQERRAAMPTQDEQPATQPAGRLQELLAEQSRRKSTQEPSIVESTNDTGQKVQNLGPRRIGTFDIYGVPKRFYLDTEGNPVEPVRDDQSTPEQEQQIQRGRVVGNLGGKAFPELTGVDLPDKNVLQEIGLGFKMLLASTPAEQGKIAEKAIEGSVLKTLPDGSTILEFDGKDGGRVNAVINRPGLSAQDANTLIAEVFKFIPAAKLTSFGATVLGRLGLGALTAGTTQAGLETAQEAAGGEFNAEQIPLAAVAGGGGEALGALGQNLPIRSVRIPRAPMTAAEEAALGTSQSVSGPPASSTQAADAIKQAQKETSDLATATRKASEGGFGSSKAMRILAEGAQPDAKVLQAAKRLNIEEYLQPDHVSTNQAFREIYQAVKSVPGSAARTVEREGFEQIAKRADDLIEEIGGTTDLSRLDASVKTRISNIQEGLDDVSEKLYKELRDEIPANAPAPATNVLTFVTEKAKDLGGRRFLSALEKRILRDLDPTATGKEPTYALVDNIRKDLTIARVRKQGPFKDADTGLIKKLEKELLKDQKAVAEEFGQIETFNNARMAVAQRKGLENDLQAIYGRNLDQSLIQKLTTGTKDLSKGDISKFTKLIKSVPEEGRQEFVASALNIAFGKNARNGAINFSQYADFYEGLLRNKQAMVTLTGSLPKESRKMLSDLYRVSNSIRKATREKITTGRLQVVADQIKGADSLISNIYQVAKKAVPGEMITSAVGIPGAGTSAAIASALTKGKPNVMRAADELIVSQPFLDAVTKQSDEAIARLGMSPAFKKYYNAAGKPRELADPSNWIMGILQDVAKQDAAVEPEPSTTDATAGKTFNIK